MLATLLRSVVVGVLLCAAVADAADRPNSPANAPKPPAESGSATMPRGKVTLPPLPFANPPDTSMPKTPNLAPLPDGSAPTGDTGQRR